jgi:hypothetical protein
MVELALQISTTSISGRRRIHVVQSMLDTSNSSGLVYELVLWVTGRLTCFAKMFYRQCLQRYPLKWSSTTAGKCAFDTKSVVYA